jgi:hypothetical protein
MLPFTREQFLTVFVGYNEAVWPVELLAAVLVVVSSPFSGRSPLQTGWFGRRPP